MKRMMVICVALLLGTCAPALAAQEDNLVDVTLEEGFVVRVPVGIAASVCDENPGQIAAIGSCIANPAKLPITVPRPFV